MSDEADKMELSESPATAAEKEQLETGEEDRMEEEISQEDMRARRLAKFSTPSSQSKSEDQIPSNEEQFPMETGTETPPVVSSKRAARPHADKSSLSALRAGKCVAQEDKVSAPMTPEEVSVM